MMRAPPSTIRCAMPAACSWRSSACRSTHPLACGSETNSRAPRSSKGSRPLAAGGARSRAVVPTATAAWPGPACESWLSTIDRLRVAPVDQAHAQLGVVGQHGADADQDAVVAGAQRVREAQRLRAAQRGALPARDGDAAVHALRVGQCDEGSPPQALAGPRLGQVLEQRVHGARRRNGIVEQGLLRAVDHAAGKF